MNQDHEKHTKIKGQLQITPIPFPIVPIYLLAVSES